MKDNKRWVEAFSENPEFQRYLVALFVMANDEAHRLSCDIGELEVDNPTMSPDGKAITFGFKKIDQPKGTGIYGADGQEIMRN